MHVIRCSLFCSINRGVQACLLSSLWLQVAKLYVDCHLRSAAVHFSGSVKPLAAASGIQLSGEVTTGRQVTGPPALQERLFQIGLHRSVTIPVSLKGSRALLKIYTNLKAKAYCPKVWYNIGLEPIIALVGLDTQLACTVEELQFNYYKFSWHVLEEAFVTA